MCNFLNNKKRFVLKRQGVYFKCVNTACTELQWEWLPASEGVCRHVPAQPLCEKCGHQAPCDLQGHPLTVTALAEA